MDIKILQITDLDAVLAFERKKLSQQSSAELDIEAQMIEWHAPWRKESLEHYLPQGWSFSLWSQNELKGYFLAQPQIYTRGLAQTLWVEYISTPQGSELDQLLELAYKISREKHFQKLILNWPYEVEFKTQFKIQSQMSKENTIEILTSRI